MPYQQPLDANKAVVVIMAFETFWCRFRTP